MADENAVSTSIYNSTFTLHRVSPLHVRNPQEFLLPPSLASYGRQLTESLKGGFASGVSLIDADQDEDTGRLGPLKKCQWTVLGNKESSNPSRIVADGFGLLDGIKIDISYERASYVALLLKDAASPQYQHNSELCLPLLLTRMPAPVRSGLLDFLAVNFDTRAEMLRLNAKFLGTALEDFMKAFAEDAGVLESVVKDVQLSIGFKIPAQGSLRTLDMAISREDVYGFLISGRAINSSNAISAGGKGPFMTSLQKYFADHLALDIDHDHVFLSRIACGAFALGREGKVKIFEPIAIEEEEDTADLSTLHKKAVVGLLRSLLKVAAGEYRAGSS